MKKPTPKTTVITISVLCLLEAAMGMSGSSTDRIGLTGLGILLIAAGLVVWLVFNPLPALRLPLRRRNNHDPLGTG